MLNTLGWLCFSTGPFRWVERGFFHRRVLWPMGIAMLLGVPFLVVGGAAGDVKLLAGGLLFFVPFFLWAVVLAAVSGVLAVPRYLVLALFLVAWYLRQRWLCRR